MECILKKTSQFKSSFKLAKKRGLDISLLEEVVNKLMEEYEVDLKTATDAVESFVNKINEVGLFE